MRFLTALLAVLPLCGAEPVPDPHRGLYAIWLAPSQSTSYPFITGGQVVVQWRDVEPADGKYDFAPIARQLEEMQRLGRAATVQINGNRHPDWMFGRVPYMEKKLSRQIQDERGTLAYWHPVYQQAYRRLVQSCAAWLKASPLKENVLGIRLNFNALGTEHFDVPEEDRDPARWTVPQSTPVASRWTREIGLDYRRDVIDNFVDVFVPDLRVFLRNNALSAKDASPEVLTQVDAGRLALFHTSSEMEPRKGNSGQYEAFLRYCRTGKTVCYAEPWADAWGRHGGQTDARWCAPEQFNYWRLLADLHCGVSFIAIYGADLAHAGEPQFREAFEFTSRYAGYHASPSTAPGAWVALRQGNTLQGDYTFLMKRSGDMVPLEKQGPAAQRFGAWARSLAPGTAVRFELDPTFARSLKTTATVSVTWLDEGKGSITVECGKKTQIVRMEATARWRTDSWKADASRGAITLSSTAPVALHMVEVRR